MAIIASNIYFVLLVSFVCGISETVFAKNITLGSSLSATVHPPSWPSPSGRFAFGFYREGDGFKVGIWMIGMNNNTIVWTANRDDPPVLSNAKLVLTMKGELLLLTGGPRQIKLAPDDVSEPADSASMLDSGNFVLYGKNQSVIWQSFNSPTDTILGGQNLSLGQGLVSALSKSDHSSGHFILRMQQTDGNLVAYPVKNERNDDAYWASNTLDTAISQLTLNLTGFLCLGEDSGYTSKVVANSSYHGSRNKSLIYRATLDVDGNFRLYVHPFHKNTSFTGQITWQALSDPCKVKGICGFNSYCSSTVAAGKAICECYPGFTAINGNNSMFLDCEEVSKDDCKASEDPRMLYDISSPLQQMQWSLVPYQVIPLKMEACGKSCQEDCDCGAVLHEEGNCKKYKLPLIFGRTNQNSTATALFKLPSRNIITPPNPKKPFIHVNNKKNLIMTLVFALGSISFVCVFLAMSIFFTYRRQVHRYSKLSVSADLGFTEDFSLRKFSFDELVKLTGNFTEEIGSRGSFGVAYKGIIHGSNKKVAVKKIDVVVDEGEREFQAEITAIARTHHRNLVQLIGYCIDGSEKLLVYEYMSNGSLADFLYKAEMHLSWKQRVKVALDVARGVLYLHEECEVCIVHCNIKPQNILMDEMWTAKISDFGLARLSMPEHSRTTITGNEATSGYVAPERQKDASASVKVDIFSYGVVLLEIICCRRSIDVNVSSEEEIMLSSWVYNCFVRGELNKLVVDDYEEVEWKTMERMVKVGLWCVQEDSSLRPSMKNVILMLEGLKDIPIPPSPIPLV